MMHIKDKGKQWIIDRADDDKHSRVQKKIRNYHFEGKKIVRQQSTEERHSETSKMRLMITSKTHQTINGAVLGHECSSRKKKYDIVFFHILVLYSSLFLFFNFFFVSFQKALKDSKTQKLKCREQILFNVCISRVFFFFLLIVLISIRFDRIALLLSIPRCIKSSRT